MKKMFRVLTPLSIAWLGMFPLSALAADTLSANQSLLANEKLTSSDGSYTFNVQSDGNLVLRNSGGTALWVSRSNGTSGNRLTMQGDGNLVLYTNSGTAVWKTATSGSNAIKVVMQSDGNLVMRTSTGSAVWSTGTSGGKPADMIKPVITLNGSASMSVVQGSTFTDPGATATDDRDGNITSKVAVWGSVNTGTAGTYTLSYIVKDAAGNYADVQSRTVTVTAKSTDTVKPVITLNGSASMFIVQGNTFTDPGATATDDRDGNITSKIGVWGSVNTGTPGTYTLIYIVQDAAGNFATQQTRTVTVTAKVLDTVKPVITLNGSASMSLVQGSTFTDPGATANDDRDGNITSKIVASGTVNTATVGTYTRSYNVKDTAGNAATTLTRTVTVTAKPDTVKPVITLNGSASMSIVQGSTFTDPGATATDDRDGNITSKVAVWGRVNTATLGTYTLIYFVQDAAGNFATEKTRTVTVTAKAVDTVKPVITLNGSASMSIVQGSTFTDPGATASDDRDGNITSKIVASGTVNTATVGTYTRSYNVKDTAGNAATTLTRTVTVTVKADTVKPVITINGSASMSVVQGSTFTDPGATASDDRDGNITSKIGVWGSVNTATPGIYYLSYIVQDAAGNFATQQTRTVTVTAKALDTVKPVITLNGSASMSIVQGSTFTDPGATATDDRDGNITSKIVASGTINTATVGTYTRTYNVKDTAGNAATTLTRTVTVTGASTEAKITLPIEVFGPSGSYVDVPVSLSNASAVTHLYLRCNSCGYDDIADNRNSSKIKATVRINGGAAIALKHFTDTNGAVTGNSNISVIGGEAKYGGIGGSFRSTRFTLKIAANQLRNGANTLRFEHVTPAAPSMGYRIIDVNFLENGDINRKVLVSGRDVVFDDPTRWTVPRPGDIAAGQALWTKRNALYDEGLDLLDGRGGKQGAVNGNLRASCADCHTKDGRDLKFFNFSNHAITQRAVFHGMSKTEGDQIASYIRSNRAPVTKRAWPWNPAYQPGPGLDSNSSAYEWAAGAGLDAVLDDDRDIAKYMFPGSDANNPPSLDGVRGVVNRFGKLNFRELPMNIPMPEWNQWLPLVHPDDAFNTDAAVIRSTPGGSNVGQPYYSKMVEDAFANPTFETLRFTTNLKPWLQRGMNCQSNGEGDAEPWRGLDGNVLEAMRLPREIVNDSNCTSIDRSKLKSIELAKRGLSAWASVKMWEIMHSKGLEEVSRTKGNRVCISGTCVDGSEVRGWYADGRNVFDRPPHFTAIDSARHFLNQSAMQGIFESNQWYHLNMVLNPGYRVDQPTHFAYTYSHVELLHEFSKVPQGFRFWATMIKQRQLQTTGKYGVEEGLDLRTAQPYIFYGTARGTTSTRTQGAVGGTYWKYLAQAMVEDLAGDARNANWSQHWSKATSNSKVQSPSSPSSDFRTCSGTCGFELGDVQGSNTYKVIPQLRSIGVQESALGKLIDWSKTMWPNGNWEALRR
jgi:hypothetical protein